MVDVREIVEGVVKKHGLYVKADHLERVIDEIERLGVEGTEDVRNLAISYLDIGESYFFRDRETWSNLENFLSGKKRVRFLSIGCSEGEEVYTFSFVASKIKLVHHSLGVDVSEDRIERAKIGVYDLRRLKMMTSKEIEEYFDKVEERYRVKDEYRVGVRFERMNIIEDFPVGIYDVIFLRRVLIYLNPEKIFEVLENVKKALKSDGILVLGKGELYRELFDLFEPVMLPGSVFWKIRSRKLDLMDEVNEVVRESFDFEEFLKKLMNFGMYSQVVNITRELMEDGFEDSTVWKYHLYALVYLGKSEEAREKLKDAIERFPEDVDLSRLKKVIS